jgi:hypothetical protein
MDDLSLGMGGDLAAVKIPRSVIHGKRADMTHYSDDAIIGASQFFATALRAKHVRDEKTIATYVLGSGLVTTAGINLLAADWTNATGTLKLANFHDSGTGITAAAIGDIAMQTATGVARVAGVQSNPVAGQYRTVATIAYAAAFAITEFGLFTAVTATTMWDHKVFAAIDVASGDSIQFIYTLTCSPGG